LECSVEGDGGTEQGVDDVGVIVELLVYHKSKDTHLRGAAIVKLDGELFLDSGVVPLGCLELGSLDLVLASGVTNLDEADEGNNLGDATKGHGLEGGEAVLHAGERDPVGDFARKTNASSGHNVAEDGKHRNTSVLGLDLTEAIETLLVSLIQETERVPETKGRLNTNLDVKKMTRKGAKREC